MAPALAVSPTTRGMRFSNLALLGFMGCGKTTIGQRVAQKIGWRFVDSDELIERKTGLTISEIFSRFGEEYFRLLETRTLLELSRETHIVLATGGGLPTREENWVILREHFLTVFLRVSFPILFERLKKSINRPLLKKYSSFFELGALYKSRIPCYLRAHVIIDADFLTEDEIAEEIICRARSCGVLV